MNYAQSALIGIACGLILVALIEAYLRDWGGK